MYRSITELLEQGIGGNGEAQAEFIEAVFPQLHRMARAYLRGERPEHTLQATALVNELFLRLVAQRNQDWRTSSHFFGVAAYLMQLILTGHARKRKAARHGGKLLRASVDNLDQLQALGEDNPEKLAAFSAALARLQAKDPRGMQVVTCRAFSGMTVLATAKLLNISERTVKDDWAYATAFLLAELELKS